MRKLILYIAFFTCGNLFAQTKIVYMAAEMNEVFFLDDFSTVEMWGYGIVKPSGAYQASLPGPVLEFNLGDTVEIHFHNTTPEDHTIHLHGLDVSMMEDGVPTTSMAVDPNDSIIYNFVAKNAGTFIYHCHVLTTLHLTMGMYGIIVVKNFPEQNLIYSGGPSYQSEHVFFATDMDRSLNINPLSPGPFNLLFMDYFMINGLSGTPLLTSTTNQVTAYPGDSVLLRLACLSYSKTRFIFPPGLNAIAYNSDGRPLPVPYACDTLTIFPGERYDVLLTPTEITDVDIQVEYYESRNDELQHINYIEVNGDVGISKEEKNEFNLYPNPVSNTIQFETSVPGNALSVYDIAGKLVFSQTINNTHSTLDLSILKSGIYILRYGDSSQKIVKN